MSKQFQTRAGVNKWIRFLRNYGPIPTNDNMYDETIQHALKRSKTKPLTLPAPYLDTILDNLRSDQPLSEVLTGTAGDGKTYHCREVWLRLGGSEKEWLEGKKVQMLALQGRQLVIVKDLSELLTTESTPLLNEMACEVASANPTKIYLIAANHGQLLEKLKLASESPEVARMSAAIEDMLFRKRNAEATLQLRLWDLSRARATQLLAKVIDEVTGHPGWESCAECPLLAEGETCPIWENRERLIDKKDGALLRARLEQLIEVCAQNNVHFPVRQLLLVVTNALLGHPAARDGLMTCEDVPEIVGAGKVEQGSVYRNIFGENLTPRRAEQTDVFKKLNAFGIGGETSNAADNLLVYGADDPELNPIYRELVASDPIYGATSRYALTQQAYLECYDDQARPRFLEMLRGQRQRLFFTLPERHAVAFELWDLTVFRYAGLFLQIFQQVRANQPVDRRAMPLIVRGLNRLSTGILIQNHDELFLATSGALSQSKRSPLLDDIISVPGHQGQKVSLVSYDDDRIAVRVKVGKGADPGPIDLVLTPTRFEFLGRVAEGALPSSFSLECQEDLLAFKARLLAATARRRLLDEDDEGSAAEIALRFIDLSIDGSAAPRRVSVRG